jgi:hypothetical protein
MRQHLIHLSIYKDILLRHEIARCAYAMRLVVAALSQIYHGQATATIH